jgi:hypothetical protein
VLPGFWPARIPNGVLAEPTTRSSSTPRARSTTAAPRSAPPRLRRFISAPTRGPSSPRWPRTGSGSAWSRPARPSDGSFPALIKVESGVGFASEPEALYPAGAPFPQLGQFPLVVSNSDDNSLRLVNAGSEVTVMTLSAPLERPEGLTRGLDGNIMSAASTPTSSGA